MQLSARQIAQILPQGYPFIMIDRVVEFKKGESLTAIKNITGNEWVFENMPRETGVFPETLLIEAAAQAAILFYKLNREEAGSKTKVLLGRAKAEFFKPVYVGDQVRFKTGAHKMMEGSGYMDVEARVDEEDVADVEIFYSLVEG